MCDSKKHDRQISAVLRGVGVVYEQEILNNWIKVQFCIHSKHGYMNLVLQHYPPSEHDERPNTHHLWASFALRIFPRLLEKTPLFLTRNILYTRSNILLLFSSRTSWCWKYRRCQPIRRRLSTHPPIGLSWRFLARSPKLCRIRATLPSS